MENQMRSTGVIRKMDTLGRYTIPISLRRLIDIENDGEIAIYQKESYIVIRKVDEEGDLVQTRRKDQLGRVVIPSEMRKNLGLEINSMVEFFTKGNEIYLLPWQPGCFCCGQTSDVVIFHGKKLCRNCIRAYVELQEKKILKSRENNQGKGAVAQSA